MKNKQINWSEVIELAEGYMTELKDKDITSVELSYYDVHVFEAVMEAIYGKKVWDEINPILVNK